MAVAVREHFTRVVQAPKVAWGNDAGGAGMPFRRDEELVAGLGSDEDNVGAGGPLMHADRNHYPGADCGAVRQQDIRLEGDVVDLKVGACFVVRNRDVLRGRQKAISEIIVDPAGRAGRPGRAGGTRISREARITDRSRGPDRSNCAGCAGWPSCSDRPGRANSSGGTGSSRCSGSARLSCARGIPGRWDR